METKLFLTSLVVENDLKQYTTKAMKDNVRPSLVVCLSVIKLIIAKLRVLFNESQKDNLLDVLSRIQPKEMTLVQ